MRITYDSDLTDWAELRDSTTWPTLLVGNGLSINIWPSFGYNSLFASATLDNKCEAVFAAMSTTNFESVLQSFAQTRVLLEAVHRRRGWLNQLYKTIRDSLFEAVREVHIPWEDLTVSTSRVVATTFDDFTRVFTLNYDLIPYWAHLKCVPDVNMGDFFWGAGLEFDPSDTDLRGTRTGIYYLHGGMHLWQDTLTGRAGKWQNEGQPILDSLEGRYRAEATRQPLFVSEGTPEHKVRSIRRSDYLSFAYDALEDDTENTVVFGTSLSSPDRPLRQL